MAADFAETRGRPSALRGKTPVDDRGLCRAFIALLLIGICCNKAAASLPAEQMAKNRREVISMFYHAYDGYMAHAFPMDDLLPLSCQGKKSFGNTAMTLVDSLDALIIFGNYTEFEKAVTWISNNLDFNIDENVSVFELNIRALGGLLSAHLLTKDPLHAKHFSPGFVQKSRLLELSVDLGNKLLKAFNTPTGIPYGSINLRHGVMEDESNITSTASATTFSLEFGILSWLTGDDKYEVAAKKAVIGLWERRSGLDLVGNHINIITGEWTHLDAGISSGIDSFYEYLMKAAMYFADEDYMQIFHQAYEAVIRHAKKDDWYVDVHMHRGVVMWPIYNSLQGFWPGVQAHTGHMKDASRTLKSFFNVWRRYGFVPEGFNLMSANIQPNQESYPLRPELAESIYFMYRSTLDPFWLYFGRDMISSISKVARTRCGFATVSNVETHILRDHMESFFLAETTKYLYLMFDPDNFVNQQEENYIFNTEGHILPMSYAAMIGRPYVAGLQGHCTIGGIGERLSCEGLQFTDF